MPTVDTRHALLSSNMNQNTYCEISVQAIVQCYAPAETSDTDKVQTFCEQANAVHKMFHKDCMLSVMDELNVKIGSHNTLLGHLMEKHRVTDQNNNRERFVDFCSFYNFVIGEALFDDSCAV